MFEPARALYAFRPHAPVALVAAAVAVATLFAATPFILAPIADRFDVALGTAGLVSVCQVAAFALASFTAGRVLSTRSRILNVAAMLGFAANVSSALAPTFPILLATRVFAGAAAGVLTWVAWSDAIADRGRLADIAAAGPLTVVLAAPMIGGLVGLGDERMAFLVIAAAHVPNVFMRADVRAATTRRIGPTRPTRSNLVLLGALAVATAGGSAMFIFTGAFATAEIGMTPVAAAAGFSLNAVAGLVGTRVRVRSGTGGWWLLGPAASVVALVLLPYSAAFYVVLVAWGLTWWFAIPEVLRSIAAYTDAPDGRMGDAQAAMAGGRAVGPIIGGAALSASGFTLLGVVSGGLLTATAVAVVAVELRRRTTVRELGLESA